VSAFWTPTPQSFSGSLPTMAEEDQGLTGGLFFMPGTFLIDDVVQTVEAPSTAEG